MLSKTAATITTSQLQTQANSYFKALFTRPEATGLSVTATFNNANGNQVVVTATADVKANFMNLMGFSTMKVAANAQVMWGNSRLRVALVLDNTGSMADDGKMPALITREQVGRLLTQLKAAAVNTGDVYVSIVLLVKDVNVGAKKLRGDPDRLDRLGSRQRELQQKVDLTTLDQCSCPAGCGETKWTGGQPQYLERLR